MNALYEAAAEIQEFCQSQGWKFCFIGGLALVRWGQPRQTEDVDLTILCEFGNEESLVDSLLNQFSSRITDARDFALANRVLLLKATNGIGIDAALGGFPFEQRVIDRGSYFSYLPEVNLFTTSAEDLVILKAFAGRPQDWIDVENVVIRQGRVLDWQLILQELTPLCELQSAPDTLERLNQLSRIIRDQ